MKRGAIRKHETRGTNTLRRAEKARNSVVSSRSYPLSTARLHCYKEMAQSKSFRPVITAIILGSLLVCLAIIFAVVWVTEHDDDDDCPSKSSPTPETFRSGTGSYKYAAVASEDELCSNIGNDILARKGGSAVDAVVATLLCSGVLRCENSGIGGGAFIVVYDKKHGWYAINSRETAPAGATKNMYAKEEDRIKSQLGGLAVGIPGEIKGLYAIHQKFGRLPWEALVTPTYNLLKDGYPLNKWVHEQVVKLNDRTGFEVYLDANGNPKPIGTIIKDLKLTKTFEILRDDPMSFYTGDLARDIAQDIQDADGIITTEDLKNYKEEWKNTTTMELPGGFTMHSMPPPGSGPIVAYILSILSGYDFGADSVSTEENTVLTYHRIVEAMKFAYGKRSALGDEDFVDIQDLVSNLTSRSFGEQTRQRITDEKTQPLDYYDSYFYNQQDHGTNHLSVLDGEGNAVAVTSTVNLYLGSKVKGNLTGIVFNNQMDDFSTPNLTNAFGFLPSASNFIVSGKRPQSSMSPTIVWDDANQKVRMIVGAAGGSKITSTTARLIMDVLWFKMSVGEAMDLLRLHHQLMPNNIDVEPNFPPSIRAGLEAKGHAFQEKTYFSFAHAIDNNDHTVDAASDYRQGGKPAGY